MTQTNPGAGGSKTTEKNEILKAWTKTCQYFHIDEAHIPERRKRVEAVAALSFMLVYAAAWFSYVPLYAIFFQNMVAAIAVAAIGLPTALGALVVQRKTKNLAIASALLNYGCVITLVGCIYATGGTWSPIYFWSFSPVAGAYLLSGAWHGIAVTAIAAVGNSVVALTTRPHEDPEKWFFQFDTFSSFHVMFYAFTVLMSMSVFSLILYLFHNKLTRALHESELAREDSDIQKQRAEAAFDTIKEQMAEKKAIMNATEVALVMIFENMKVDPEKSSAYFQKLFPGIDNFSQALKKMNLDATSDLLKSVIGEDELTWSMNSSSFPLEAVIDGHTHELEWKQIQSKGVINAVVFAAKNVQPLLDSKTTMENMGRYAKLLVTVLGGQESPTQQLKEKKPRLVLKTINRQIPQIEEAIARAEISLVDNWQPIYITLHTLKGEVGSFHFSELRDDIHRTEEHVKHVNDIRQAAQDNLDDKYLAEIDKVKNLLILELRKIRDQLLEIRDICRQTGADQSSVVLPRDLLMVAKDDLKHLQEIITNSLYEDLSFVIKGFESEIYKIAGDLGKPSPRLVVSCPKIYLSDYAADKIRQAFTHIIRNSLDHGIESREERLKKGKSEIGELTFLVEDTDEAIVVRVRDDGRGLNLVSIREKAESQGLMGKGREYTASELADFVLLPGFSTTRSVSMISGRGIGMEAARGFMTELGGSFELKLLDHSLHPALEIRLSIPKLHVPLSIQNQPRSLSA